MSHLTTAVLVGVVAVVGYWYLGSSQLQDLDTTKLDSTYDYIIGMYNASLHFALSFNYTASSHIHT